MATSAKLEIIYESEHVRKKGNIKHKQATDNKAKKKEIIIIIAEKKKNYCEKLCRNCRRRQKCETSECKENE